MGEKSMKIRRRALTAMTRVWLVLLAVLTAGVSPAAAVSFDTIDVPEVPATYVCSVNQSGLMSGFYMTGTGTTSVAHGFTYDGANFRTIEIPGASQTRAYGINDSGSFVGYYITDATHGFIHNGVSHQPFDIPGAQNTWLYGMNNQGKVAGAFQDAQGIHGFVADSSDSVNFTTLNASGTAPTRALGINNDGKVVGFYTTTVGTTQYTHGFVYGAGTYTPIDILGATHTFATGINDSGTIAGYYLQGTGSSTVSHGFTFNGSPTTVDVPGATNTSLTSINHTGRLTGYYRNTASTTLHGCVSSDTTPVNLVNYYAPNPLSRWCRYVYITPEGFPGFTLRFTPITSGTYAGKYRMGDWHTPEDELAVWLIVSWDAQALYVYGDSKIGYLPSPVWFSTIFPQNTPVPNPLPGEVGIYWYYKTIPSFTVAAGTFSDVLIDIVLDSAYPPNSMNTALGLSVPYAVTCVTYYGRGIGELKMMDVDAQTGNINFSYQLQSTGVGGGGGMPAVQFLLLH
jgi:probable HAF family extracellular repeat protein